MLTVRPKISELAFRAFGRSLHPELFQIHASRTITRDQYQLNVDITNAGHLLTWQRDGQIVSEVACSQHQPLPQALCLFSDTVRTPHSDRICHGKLDYQFHFQREPADPKTFAMIQMELLKSVPCEGMVFQFQASGRLDFGAISYVNIQSRRNAVHVRAFHTFPDAYVVMKSESVFTVVDTDV